MTIETPGEVNPFEAPKTLIGEVAFLDEVVSDEEEKIRRDHLGREANIKSLGLLGYLIAALTGFITVVAIFMALGVIPMPPEQARSGMDPTMQKIVMGAGALFYLIVTLVTGGLGFGLRGLHAWARWTGVTLGGLGVVGVLFYSLLIGIMLNPGFGVGLFLIAGGFDAFVLYLLLSKQSGVVFSSEYREIIRKTPQIRLKTSIIVKIFLGLLVAFVLVALLGGLISGLRN